ncbi:hypothetical protein CGRA01v4_06695 [Colletotrichum graminicola]|nr:hypothetical protein CGRA01v4_06695 [Colletotrichum graminicola]
MPSSAAVLVGYRYELPSPSRFRHRSPLAEMMVLVPMPLYMPFRSRLSGEPGSTAMRYKSSVVSPTQPEIWILYCWVPRSRWIFAGITTCHL